MGQSYAGWRGSRPSNAADMLKLHVALKKNLLHFQAQLLRSRLIAFAIISSGKLRRQNSIDMNNDECCPNGRSECDFPENHELALAGSLLRMIENYTKEHRTYPCPKCLRNSMMAIAALLHLEALKIEDTETPCERMKPGESGFVEGFAQAARERLLYVMDAMIDLDGGLAKRRLM
jgi:hypothetical protein